MTTYRIKIGFHNPSALTFRLLDDVLADEDFRRANTSRCGVRYYNEYEFDSEAHDYCSVCQLAYSRACQVKKCPLVLVEEKKQDDVVEF